MALLTAHTTQESVMAYVLLAIALLLNAIANTLLKIGAQVRLRVRRLWISLSSAYPWQSVFLDALSRLRASPT